MEKYVSKVEVSQLKRATRTIVERDLFPLSRSEFACDLCGFENEVDEEKKIVVECQKCHHLILGGVPMNEVNKYYRCGCNLLVFDTTDSKRREEEEKEEKAPPFLGECPDCHRILLIGFPDMEDTRYCLCPCCQECFSYGKRTNCFERWPISNRCENCDAFYSFPRKRGDPENGFRTLQICIFVLICLGIFYFYHALVNLTPTIYISLQCLVTAVTLFSILYYPKWRWGTPQELQFDSENLPETLKTLTVWRRNQNTLKKNTLKKNKGGEGSQ